MNRVKSLAEFAARLREWMRVQATPSNEYSAPPAFAAQPQRVVFPRTSSADADLEFNRLALELFALQYAQNRAYRDICDSRGLGPGKIGRWEQIPAVPALAFKELDLSCIPEGQRTRVFFSSGTTEHRPSRHFHHLASLQVYEASVLDWFPIGLGQVWLGPGQGSSATRASQALALTPAPDQAPHSSLVHMFETLRRGLAGSGFAFVGRVDPNGGWQLQWERALAWLQNAGAGDKPVMLLGTAFSYVHLLDHLTQINLDLRLPTGSWAMETGGYKGRSRELPKTELHSLISRRLGIPASHIVCEYGMSELSSQAYDRIVGPDAASRRLFRFPPWARIQIVSPETGQQAREGTPGLLRIFDLANVYSVLAVQTEDLAIGRGEGFELLGRAALAEARGCSLMAV